MKYFTPFCLRAFLGFALFLTLNSSVKSQDLSAKIDSLSSLLNEEKEDTLLVQHHLALYELLKSTNPSEARAHLEKGLLLSKEGGYQALRVRGLELLGYYWLDRGMADSTLKVVNEARKITVLDGKQKATFLLLEGRALDAKGQYYEAVEKLLESLALSESIDDGPAVANIYGNIGNVFWHMENLAKAEEYYEKGIEAARQNKLLLKSAHLLANLGIIAKERGEYEKARDSYLQSLEINRSLGNKLDEAIDLMNIGVLYMDNKELTKAKKYLTESSMLSREVNDKIMITLSTINLAIAEEKSGNYRRELALLDTAKELAIALHYKPALKEIFNSYSFAYSKLGNYKAALENQKLYEAWKDSIYNENYANKISELEVKYESEKSRNEILVLSEENLKKEAMLTQQGWWIKFLVGGVVVVLIISMLGFYIFRQKARYAEQEALFQAIAQTEVTEQRRIARDLHDSIGSMLATVSNQLSGLYEDFDRAAIQKSTVLLNQTSEEVRRIAHNMMPEELMKFGLVSALQGLLDNLNSLKLEVEFVHYGMTTRIEPTKEVHIFRIIQELVQNVTKHAQAKKVILNLTRQGNRLNIMVQDDGLGFDRTKGNDGIGLASIKSRLGFLKGKFTIDSFPNQGSTVILDIPLN